jgi:hypothetical protein
MNREEVLRIVTRHVAEAAGERDDSAIDPARSMRAYGLGSLDMAEVMSRTLYELNLDVPLPAPRRLTSINDLVDLLYRGMEKAGS